MVISAAHLEIKAKDASLNFLHTWTDDPKSIPFCLPTCDPVDNLGCENHPEVRNREKYLRFLDDDSPLQ